MEPTITQITRVHDNPFFAVDDEELSLANGGSYTYHRVVAHHQAVIVVPVMADGRFVVERIYRHPYRQWFWEFPAGGIDHGEDPVAAAQRELAEETGMVADSCELLGSYAPISGLAELTVHVVAAHGCHAGADTALEALELLEVHQLSRSELMQKVTATHDNEIASGFLGYPLFLYDNRFSRSKTD